MRHYSNQLSRRLIGLGLGMLLFLALTMLWFTGARVNASGETNFTPAARVAELSMMASALKETLESNAEVRSVTRNPFACDARQMAILKIRLMTKFTLDTIQVDRWIHAIEERVNSSQPCARWVSNLGILADSISQRTPQDESMPLQQRLEQALTEQVSWTARTPCLFYAQEKQLGLAFGSPVRCVRKQASFSAQAHPLSGGMKKAIGWSKTLMANAPADAFPHADQQDLILTLDDRIQSVLDSWATCLPAGTCARSTPIAELRHVSVVVLDSATGDILAALCWSGPCDKHRDLGNLGAFLVETPPASTVKMLHAMVLAENQAVDQLMLQRQIKTSGQVGMGKHNEWWEKQSICDGKAGPCLHPMRVNALAQKLGLGTDCDAADLQCGRMGLVKDSKTAVFSGFVGKIKTTSTVRGAPPMLDWSTYDQIRQHKRLPPNTGTYLNTLLSVQSAIGAGDTRTSALGIAYTASQVSRLSQGLPINRPNLIRPLTESTVEKPQPSTQRAAATTVMAGMRKVLEPAESGWVGAGTVAAAFERNFKRPCSDECGLWAKTGTVGSADKGFAGVTLVAGLIEMQKLRTWRYQTTSTASPQRIAFGIVVYPQTAGSGINIASEFAMQLAADLTQQTK
jgi:hypothetical protein